MGRITALRVGGGKKRVNVFVDGSFSFAIDGEVAGKAGLQVGQHLSADQIEELTQASLFQNCLDAALRYLSYRPRSDAEVTQRLRRHGFADDVVSRTITELRERKLIDDVALDDEVSAYEAGLKKARVVAVLDYGEFGRRLSGYLRRRGFSYEVISAVVARLWHEQQTTSV
jgi:regulatory protein